MPEHVVRLPNGITMPTLGQGTWFMGESSSAKKEEIAALQHGIDLGMTLIDTAEMYASGGAEKVTGEAIAGRRDKIFLVSKVLPGNASRKGTVAALERSLQRLKTDYLDLYLLHWRGSYPLSETFEAMEQLVDAGKIRAYGVSNFDLDDMEEAAQYDNGNICVNQVLYNLASRGIEWDLLPWQKKRNIPVMAYSPLYQTRLLKSSGLKRVAEKLSITPAQLALAWLLHQGTVPIPKSSSLRRVEENRKAWDITLDQSVLDELDAIFPPPDHKMPLDVL
ncbi:aldo/keto reductase [Oxalobacter formigenes]|uniref:Putative glyoxal reductase n=1 Tax=Oxalobacter formigenes OXCC13 TaxID=556269 RepID=C3XBK0_OXAFO|nr:aldo/keto reductase [Oxalobacter formigenes]ARQ45255.1 Glyoxal reductase [Oxalobacter formigenes]ARQ77551.1 aldo/keto reductase [Oxalobacter formigenes OXCC13]EEO30576.1 putative glyoxal reductase [Oxalobacter formigenes OXCC13]MCZ4062451.1 aldo/keto reductase [Oxalobacter formigenes]QDX33908.1 aldo/keto reductase [Oxalobacter formigenes]